MNASVGDKQKKQPGEGKPCLPAVLCTQHIPIQTPHLKLDPQKLRLASRDPQPPSLRSKQAHVQQYPKLQVLHRMP